MTVKFTDEELQNLIFLVRSQQHGTFANFTHNYHGERDAEKIEEFLLAATEYKMKQYVDDDEAISGLSLLLKDDAAEWWKEISKEIKTWGDFPTALRKAFKPEVEGYLVFLEIFDNKQLDNVSTKDFVAKKRALFAQLTPPPPENTQLDMMYSLLNDKIKEKVPRESFDSYAELLEKAKVVEQSYNKNQSETQTGPKQKSKRIRCNFCRMYGHTADVCRRKLSCATSRVSEEEAASFLLDLRRRPTIGITIGEINETAFLDTGAGMTIASYNLYQTLLKMGYEFTEESITYSLVDGIKKTEDFPTVNVPVGLQGRIIPTTFRVFPESRKNVTLLGMDFMIDAGMVLDIPQLVWYFNDEPTVMYDIQEEED